MTQPAGRQRRWDTDERYAGVADASAFSADIEELAVLARRQDWVAEDPHLHLVPHLRDAAVPGLRFIEAGADKDGVLNCRLEHTSGASRGAIRASVWTLLGAVAETMASVRERRDGEHVVFDVVIGEPGSPEGFATHGHTLRLTAAPPPG